MKEKWIKLQAWRARLAARVVETQAGRLFDSILIRDPVPTDAFAYYDIVYTFFRIYLSLPEEEKRKFKDLAEELAGIVNS